MNSGYNTHKDHKDSDRKREIFMTASLINKLNEGCHIDEVYKRSIECYETLLNLIEKPEVKEEISGLIKQPREKIENIAKRILNLLLFNKENDPFLSFGITKDATYDEIRKRWKRLLMIYHPDRMSDQKGYEEIAKRINQVYKEIEEIKKKSPRDYNKETVTRERKKVIKNEDIYYPSDRYFHSKYLRYLPTFIIVIAISITIFTIVLLFIRI